MIEKYVRPAYQVCCVDPLARTLMRHSFLTPLTLTFIGCIFGLGAAICVAFNRALLGVIFLFLSGYFDTLDGTLARLRDTCSPFGTVCDILCDRVVEAAMLIALYLVSPLERGGATLAMFASVLLCVTSFLVVGIFSENSSEKSFHYSPGLIERAEAFFFFALMILFPLWFTFLAWTFTLLVLFTAACRIYQFAKI